MSPHKQHSPLHRPALTLTELLVVIEICAVTNVLPRATGTAARGLAGERHGVRRQKHFFIVDPGYQISDSSWQSDRWYDTLFTTFYPLNLVIGSFSAIRESSYYHAGGANVLSGDGSTGFIKKINNAVGKWRSP